MRHGKKINHLSRKAPHRKAMMANMACSLIEHKRIKTTLAKAKALQKFVEPLVTKSKTDSTHSRRTAFRHLRSKYAVTELFREVAPKVNDRPGGYTRIIKLAPRLGDNADMAYIELVDFNELMLAESQPKASKAKRSRRGGGSKKSTTPAAEVETAVEDVVEETKAEVTETVEEAKVVEETPDVEAKAETEEAPTEEKKEEEGDAEEEKPAE